MKKHKKQANSEVVVILHNIRSNQNVGAIFRTADAAGIKKVFLTGYSPAPLDRFGREVKEISKVALGAEKNIPWEKQTDIKKVIKELKKKKFFIVSLEQSGDSIDYKKIKLPSRSAIIFGNEVNGVEKEVLSMSDTIAEIPMKGNKESLNVSVAAGVALFRLLGI